MLGDVRIEVRDRLRGQTEGEPRLGLLLDGVQPQLG